MNSIISSPPPRNCLKRIFVLSALFLGLHMAFVTRSGVGAKFAESNFQTNMLRVQGYLYGSPAETVLVGSSISGRLLPEYFETAGARVANLGLDGATAQSALQVIEQSPKLPKIVLVEIGAATREPTSNDPLLVNTMQEGTFRLAKWLPFLRAEFRPSSIAYSWLKESKDRDGSIEDLELALVAQRFQSKAGLTTNPLPHINNQSAQIIKSLQQKGVRIVLLRLPINSKNPDAAAIGFALAGKLNTEYLDVASILEEAKVRVEYSDGLHMKAASARRAALVMASWLKGKVR